MAKFTLHNQHGSFMHDSAKTIQAAKDKCDKQSYKCIVYETYYAQSPWRPWDPKLVAHGREVHRNF